MSTTNNIRDFVSQNVIWNQTSLVEEMITREPEYWDAVEYVEEEEDREIFSWYLVSDYLAAKLREANEPILEACNCIWWGRTTFGQLIESDSVIEDIFMKLDK